MAYRLTGYFCVLLTSMLAARAVDRPLIFERDVSRVEIVVRATVDSFVGKLNRFDPVVTIGADGRVSSACLDFGFREVATGKQKRDEAMHVWQETEKFPGGRFELVSLMDAPDAPGGRIAAGRLTLHGVTRDLRFPISVLHQNGRYTIDGDAAIDTREFGLPIIRTMVLLKVDPVVHVRFHLEGSPSS